MPRTPSARWLILVTALIAATTCPARALELGYGGRLVDATGSPLPGPVDVTLRFFGSPNGVDQLGKSLRFSAVPLRDGVFELELALDDEQRSQIFGDGSRRVYVEVEAEGQVHPRQSFQAVPLALRIPVDNDTLVFSPETSRLTIDHVSISQVTGLTEALAARPSETPASSSASGYLSSDDWARFDAKQEAISDATTVGAGGFTTARQDGLVVKPFGSGAGETGEVRFEERTSGHYVGFKAPDAIAANRIWTLPAGDGGSGDVLVTDGAGALSWTSLGLGALATQDAVSGSTITDGSIRDADIDASAAIADTKLATITTPGKVSGTAIASGTIGGTAAFSGSGGVQTTGAVTGTGNFNVSGTGAATTELRFGDNDNSNYVGLKAPAAVAANKVWTLPATDGGAGQFLATNGSGVLSWGSPAGGGDVMASANLSDLANVSTARTNLGLGALATLSNIGSSEISDGAITDADVSGSAAIATSKLSGPLTSISGHGLGSLATLSAISGAEIANGSIADADVSGSAAIATSKLSGAVTSIAGHGLGTLATKSAVGTADITDDSVASADIADATIVDADVSGTAAIATSKLSGPVTSISGHGLGALATASAIGSSEIADGQIANADISDTAAIATSKLSGALTAVSGHGLGALATMSAVGASEISDGSIADADISGSAQVATSKLSGAVTAIAGHGLGALATASSISSSDVTDGTLVDADIATSAQIATSKLSGAVTAISGHGLGALASAGAVAGGAGGTITDDSITDADISSGAAIADTKLATLSTAGKVANSATTAASANTASAIVARDASGNFSAGTITANLTGNVNGSATSFTGSLAGDVTGAQSSTSVTALQGRTLASTAPSTGQALLWNGSSWGPGSIAAGGLTWTTVTGTSQTAATGHAYVTDNASRVTITLPSTCAVGDMIRVIGQGAGGWALNGTGITLTALSGSSLSLPHDSIFAKQSVDLVCVVANAQWRIHYVTSLPPPTLASVATQTLSTDTPFSYTLSASDVSGEPITYSCFSGCPVGLTVNATTGVVSWTPTSSQGGSYSITFSASNGTSSAQASTTFSVRHVMLDAIANQSLTVGVAFAYTLVGTSSAGAAVTYSCSANCPSGLSVNGGSGVVSWTPTSGQIGTFSNVTFLASDGAASATRSATFTVIDYPASCKAIKIANPSAASGTYTIDPDGAASSTVTPFTAYCDMTSGDGGWTLALVQNVGTNWAALSSAGAPTDPSAASSTVLTHQAFTAMSPTGMYLEDSARHILKFYYPRSGVTFVSNYRNLTERTAYNASHYGGDGPHTGVGRSSPGHADQACTTGSYAAFLAQSDCNVDATNSHPSWGNTPGGSQTYGGSSACWFYGGGNMTDIPSLTTCNTGDRAPWGTYTTGTLSGTIRLWIR